MNQLRESVRSLLPVEYRCSIEFAGGVFAAIAVPDFNTRELINRLASRGVDVFSTEEQFLPHFPKKNLLRLGIMRTSEQEIEEGIGIIAEELEHAKQQVKSTTTPLIWV
ncbi:hypothetical protein [Paenibacillus sp. Z3-2]